MDKRALALGMLAAFVLGCAAAGWSVTSAYFSDRVDVGMSFIAVIPTETPEATPTPAATATAPGSTPAAATETATAEASETPEPEASDTPAASPTSATTATPDATPTPTVPATPGVTMTPEPTPSTPASTATAQSTKTARPTKTALPAKTATATPAPSECPNGRGRLAFVPRDVERHGDGPMNAAISLKNQSHNGAVAYVSIGLSVTEGAPFIDRIVFSTGQVWLVQGQPASTLIFIGDLDPGASGDVMFTAYMRPEWTSAGKAVARISLRVTSATCADSEDASATIVLRRNGDGGAQQSRGEAGVDAASSRTPAVASRTSGVLLTAGSLSTPAQGQRDEQQLPSERTETRKTAWSARLLDATTGGTRWPFVLAMALAGVCVWVALCVGRLRA